MPIEDKNGCLHSEENGRFVYKTDPRLIDALCSAFGVDVSVKDKRRALIAKISKERKLLSNRNWLINNFGHTDFDIQTLSPTPTATTIRVNKEHWSRLQVMFSDYYRGACKPIEDTNGVKYFNIDNTLYLTEGQYPYFRIYKAIHFKTTFSLERYLKKIK